MNGRNTSNNEPTDHEIFEESKIEYSTILKSLGPSGVQMAKSLHEMHKGQSDIKKLDHLLENGLSGNMSFEAIKSDLEDISGKKFVSPTLSIEKVGASGENVGSSVDKVLDAKVEYILKKVKDQRELIVNNMIFWNALSAAVLISYQTYRILCFWREIKDAKNVLWDSRNGPNRTEINEHLKELNSLKSKLEPLQISYENNSISEEVKKTIVKNISKINTRMTKIYSKTIVLISEIRLLVDGKQQKLISYQHEQVTTTITNSVSFLTNIAQFVLTKNIASTFYKTIQGIITLAFLLSAAANTTMYYLTEKRVKEIRKELSILNGLNTLLLPFDKLTDELQEFLETE